MLTAFDHLVLRELPIICLMIVSEEYNTQNLSTRINRKERCPTLGQIWMKANCVEADQHLEDFDLRVHMDQFQHSKKLYSTKMRVTVKPFGWKDGIEIP
jgi:hypothetical protein